MKKIKKKIILKNAKSKGRSDDEVLVMFESLKNDIQIIAEGQSSLSERFDNFRDEMYGFKDEMYGFKDEMCGFRDEMYGFRDEMYGFRDEMYGFRDETKNNFKVVFEYLSRIDDELQDIKKEIKEIKIILDKKAEIKIVLDLEKRVEKLEKELFSYRKMVLAKG